MHIGLRAKILILVSILLLVIFGTITIFQITTNTKNLRTNVFEESRAFASLATSPIGNTFSIYKDSGTYKIDQEIKKYTDLNSNITNVAVVDINGRVVFSQTKDKKLNITADQASTFDPLYEKNQAGALATVIFPYIEASGAHRYSLVYTVSDLEINRAVRREAQSLIYFGIGSMVATLTLVYLLINLFIIKPVRQVSEQAMSISAGNLEQQIAVHGHNEIASLGESVNKMAESLKANIAQLQEIDKVKSEFMMITSHNLRTPLTIINGYLENMNLVMGNADKLMEALTRIGSSVKRLEIFAEDVLTISRLELGGGEFKSDVIELKTFMDRIDKEFRPTADLKDIKFVTDIQDGETQLQISVPYIHSALWNILDNAAKFTKEHGTIKLSTKREDDTVQIAVSDSGIGISANELPKLFTKFHRGTSTLTYDFEGTGIGLYASKVMVEKHGGRITAISQEGVGSTFTIHLPLQTINTPKPVVQKL